MPKILRWRLMRTYISQNTSTKFISQTRLQLRQNQLNCDTLIIGIQIKFQKFSRQQSHQQTSQNYIFIRFKDDSPQTQTMSYEKMALNLHHFHIQNQLQNVIFMGHSMGGRIIFSYLQNYTTYLKIGNIIIDVGLGEGEGKNYVQQLKQIDLKNKTLKDIEQNIMQIMENKDKTKLIMTNLTYVNKQEYHSDYKWKINIDVTSNFMSIGHQQFKSNYQGSAYIICGEKPDYVSQTDRHIFKQVFQKQKLIEIYILCLELVIGYKFKNQEDFYLSYKNHLSFALFILQIMFLLLNMYIFLVFFNYYTLFIILYLIILQNILYIPKTLIQILFWKFNVKQNLFQFQTLINQNAKFCRRNIQN